MYSQLKYSLCQLKRIKNNTSFFFKEQLSDCKDNVCRCILIVFFHYPIRLLGLLNLGLKLRYETAVQNEKQPFNVANVQKQNEKNAPMEEKP